MILGETKYIELTKLVKGVLNLNLGEPKTRLENQFGKHFMEKMKYCSQKNFKCSRKDNKYKNYACTYNIYWEFIKY